MHDTFEHYMINMPKFKKITLEQVTAKFLSLTKGYLQSLYALGIDENYILSEV